MVPIEDLVPGPVPVDRGIIGEEETVRGPPTP